MGTRLVSGKKSHQLLRLFACEAMDSDGVIQMLLSAARFQHQNGHIFVMRKHIISWCILLLSLAKIMIRFLQCLVVWSLRPFLSLQATSNHKGINTALPASWSFSPSKWKWLDRLPKKTGSTKWQSTDKKWNGSQDLNQITQWTVSTEYYMYLLYTFQTHHIVLYMARNDFTLTLAVLCMYLYLLLAHYADVILPGATNLVDEMSSGFTKSEPWLIRRSSATNQVNKNSSISSER